MILHMKGGTEDESIEGNRDGFAFECMWHRS